MDNTQENHLTEAERKLYEISYACRGDYARANEGYYPPNLSPEHVPSLNPESRVIANQEVTYFPGGSDFGAIRLVAVSPQLGDTRVGLFSVGAVKRLSTEEYDAWLQLNAESAADDSLTTEDVIRRINSIANE